MLGNSWVAAQVAVSQEGLGFMKLVILSELTVSACTPRIDNRAEEESCVKSACVSKRRMNIGHLLKMHPCSHSNEIEQWRCQIWGSYSANRGECRSSYSLLPCLLRRLRPLPYATSVNSPYRSTYFLCIASKHKAKCDLRIVQRRIGRVLP
jgi:hypothetical protein